jgi:hypothetical protein
MTPGATRFDSLRRPNYPSSWFLLRERTRPGLGIIEPCLPSPCKAAASGLPMTLIRKKITGKCADFPAIQSRRPGVKVGSLAR